MHSKDLAAKRHTFVYARIQKNRALTWSYGHFVGAYGVVGFSGVKDARRESFLADASASAAFSTVFEGKGCKTIAEGQQLESSPVAKQERLDSKGIAP
jgi:hypothetical protein